MQLFKSLRKPYIKEIWFREVLGRPSIAPSLPGIVQAPKKAIEKIFCLGLEKNAPRMRPDWDFLLATIPESHASRHIEDIIRATIRTIIGTGSSAGSLAGPP